MSSLSATQADGYYIPPSYLDSGAYKKQSISQYVGSEGHNQYLKRSVVRFELPYDGFCDGCQSHVGKGTRFNAHKSHVGDYYTTKIWDFAMKCRACAKQPFSIRTNPQGRCFDYVSGIRKKIEEFDPVEAGTLGVIDTTANNGKNTIHSDLIVASDGVFENLEKQVAVKQQKMTERDSMELLLRHSNATMYNDSVSNSKLRSAYRTSRKARKRRLGDAKRIGLCAGIEISEPIPNDARIAKAIFDKKAIQSLRSHSRNQDFCSDLRASSIFMSTEGYENVKRKEKHYNIRATLVNPDRNKTHSIPNKNLDSDISSAVIRSNQKQTSKDDNSIENDISSLLALQGYESDEE